MLTPPRPLDEDARLAGLARLEIVDTAREDRFDRIVRLAARVLEAPMSALSFIDSEREWFKSTHGWTASEQPRDQSLAAHAILGTEPLVVGDLTEDERFADHPWAEAGHVRFYAAVPLRGPDGGHIGALAVLDAQPRRVVPELAAALADIGKLAEDELEVREAHRRPKAAQAAPASGHAPALLDAMPVPAILIGSGGAVLSCNDAWGDSGGIAHRDDRIGTNFLERLGREKGVHEEAAGKLAAAIHEVLEGQRDRKQVDLPDAHARAHVTRAEGGAAIWLEDRRSASRHESAEELLQARAIDLAEARGTIRYWRRQAESIEQDINTPITPVRLQLPLLLTERLGPLTGKQRKALETLVRNVSRWDELTKDLLAAAKHEHDASGESEVDMRNLVAEVAHTYQTAALKAGITLTGPRSGTAIVIRTDPLQAKHVVSEYLEAALQATGAGGNISVDVSEEKGEAIVSVRDTGSGYRPNELARIFEPSAELAEDPDGMRLVRCMRMVRDLGGDAWAESEGPGRGATLAFRLPPS